VVLFLSAGLAGRDDHRSRPFQYHALLAEGMPSSFWTAGRRIAITGDLCSRGPKGSVWECRLKTLIKSLPQRVSAEGESVPTIRLAVIECSRLPSELIRDFGNEEAVQTGGCQPLFKSGSHEGSSR
jgi:hypothetical protein